MELAIYYAILSAIFDYRAVNEHRPSLRGALHVVSLILLGVSVAVYLKGLP